MKRIYNRTLLHTLEEVEIVSENAQQLKEHLLDSLEIPSPAVIDAINRSSTEIDWQRMPKYYKLPFDDYSEDVIVEMLINSRLAASSKVLILFSQLQLFVKVPTDFFIQDWERFFICTGFQTLIFSEDYKQIMEVSRDYYLHSNFKIYDDKMIEHT